MSNESRSVPLDGRDGEPADGSGVLGPSADIQADEQTGDPETGPVDGADAATVSTNEPIDATDEAAEGAPSEARPTPELVVDNDALDEAAEPEPVRSLDQIVDRYVRHANELEAHFRAEATGRSDASWRPFQGGSDGAGRSLAKATSGAWAVFNRAVKG